MYASTTGNSSPFKGLSPSSSPPRKRQRLSSPTYDEFLEDLSQDHLDAFDALDAHLSQASRVIGHSASNEGRGLGLARPLTSCATKLTWGDSKSHPSIHASLQDDPDNPFKIGTPQLHSKPATSSTVSFSNVGFAPARGLANLQTTQNYERSPSPEAPPETDYDAWFNPAPVDVPVAFQTAKSVSLASAGFQKASAPELIAPSHAALATAREKLRDIWADDGHGADITDENDPSFASQRIQMESFKPATRVPAHFSPERPALRTMKNLGNTPATPSPLAFSRPPVTASPPPSFSPAGRLNLNISNGSKAFKSPLRRGPLPNSNKAFSSPLNPRHSVMPPTSTSVGSTHPLSAPPISRSFATPASSKQRSNGVRVTPAPFVTPFKPGMKPGEPGRANLQGSAKRPPLTPVTPTTFVNDGGNWLTRERRPSARVASSGSMPKIELRSSGLQPQRYTSEELECLGVNVPMLNRMTPTQALSYKFRFPASLSRTSSLLGPSDALEALLERGFILATEPWVKNHWCLILWKLAGMVCLDPHREVIPEEKRWRWEEVIRQLLYRYERELNGGSRPPFRQIVARDAPAAFPLVLCVSGVSWSEPGVTEDGLPIEPHPELEVTDGWYRLRAQVDRPMARAIRKGTIKIGRKIGVAGARLSSERKDPMEILEAYNSTKLVISGNSSHLVPWHTKLGFQRGPCVSTLHSLTADGGVVAAMDLIIIKMYPIAFVEFFEDEDGQKRREGPRNEIEEAQVNEKWVRRREIEASKLRGELEKKTSRYESYIDRLERKAGINFQPKDGDYPPDKIDDLYDQLEGPTDAAGVLARISPGDAGWLAKHIRRRIESDQERIGEEIEQELRTNCPARDVRSFRILIVKDARTDRRPANRTAQLTVWDVLNLSLSEGSAAGTFELGKRYLVTNVIPTQPNAWMDCEPGSEVYLSTRRDSRWTAIKSKSG